MKKQSIARSLISAIKARVELDKSFGVDFVNIELPERKDLSRVEDTVPDQEEMSAGKPSNISRAFDAFKKSSGSENKKNASAINPIKPAVNFTAAPGNIAPAASVRADLPDIMDMPEVSDKEQILGPLREEALVCKKCQLCQTRSNVVFGEGDINTDLVFVGEAPGRDEDLSGRPFVGRAGELLTGMIEKGMKRPRSSVYICNIIKCRPPQNRDPNEVEISSCIEYLYEQLTVIRPKLIIALGRIAGQILAGQNLSMRSLRGRFFRFRGIPMMPIYHPAYLLRARQRERGKTQEDMLTWQDLQKAMKFLAEN